MELALLSAIQQLPGRQRAVLILRDVLGWSSPEVAEMLESTVAAVNSALQRARATVDRHVPLPSPEPPDEAERELLDRYVDVWERDDVDGLVALLREDAILRMPPTPSVHGAAAIAMFFRETAAGGDLSRIRMIPTRANARPAVAMHRRADDGTLEPHGILVLEVAGGAIAGIDAFPFPGLLPLFGFPH
jgi:RNA polymerase sigma-70 factor (ECF subfamily)